MNTYYNRARGMQAVIELFETIGEKFKQQKEIIVLLQYCKLVKQCSKIAEEWMG